jgi:hypothetical protein
LQVLALNIYRFSPKMRPGTGRDCLPVASELMLACVGTLQGLPEAQHGKIFRHHLKHRIKR